MHHRPPRLLTLLLLSCVLLAAVSLRAAPSSPFLGRWALTLPNGAAGWLEVADRGDWQDGSLLWGGGSVLPLASVTLADDRLVFTRLRVVRRTDGAGDLLREQTLTETFTATADGDQLQLTRSVPRDDGRGFDRADFRGRRIPPLPPAPDLAQVRFGPPQSLFNGRDLTGWTLIGRAANGWSVHDGVLLNRPEQTGGQPRRHYGNLRTVEEFEDFNLTLEVKVPPNGNSGVYLRGIYEVQVADSHRKPADSHHMGAIYSRITPSTTAERPAGEWQSLDITLVDRHVTVILNGITIIDNQPLPGCTGGALWSDEFRPGPVYLQGDHQAVDYRNLVLRPVVR